MFRAPWAAVVSRIVLGPYASMRFISQIEKDHANGSVQYCEATRPVGIDVLVVRSERLDLKSIWSVALSSIAQ